MEHTVTAPSDGVLAELNVEPGRQVDVGAVLARVDDPEGDPVTANGFIESEERQALRKAVAAMAANYGQDYYLEKARAGEHTDELWEEAGKLGFIGVNLPEEYGGGGAGMYELSLVMEEMSAGGCALLLMVVSPAINGTIIAKFGTDEQKKRWLPGIADGSTTMAFAITEPDAGLELAPHHHHRAPRRQRLDPQGPEGVHLRRRPGAGGAGRRPRPIRHGAKSESLKPALFIVPTDTPGLHLDQDRHGNGQPGEPVPGVHRRRPAALRRAGRVRGRRDRPTVRRPEPRADHGRGQRGRAWAASRSTRPSTTSRPARCGRRRSAHTRACRIRWRRTTSRSSSPS